MDRPSRIAVTDAPLSQMRDNHAGAIRGTVQRLHGTLSPRRDSNRGTRTAEAPSAPSTRPAPDKVNASSGRQQSSWKAVSNTATCQGQPGNSVHPGVDDRESSAGCEAARARSASFRPLRTSGVDADGLRVKRVPPCAHPVDDPFGSTHRLQGPPATALHRRPRGRSCPSLLWPYVPDPLIDGVDDADFRLLDPAFTISNRIGPWTMVRR